jgi:hypothetical protein
MSTTDPRVAELEQEIRTKELEVEKASAKVTLLLEAIDALPADSPDRAVKKENLAEWKSERDNLQDRPLQAQGRAQGTRRAQWYAHLFPFLFRTKLAPFPSR